MYLFLTRTLKQWKKTYAIFFFLIITFDYNDRIISNIFFNCISFPPPSIFVLNCIYFYSIIIIRIFSIIAFFFQNDFGVWDLAFYTLCMEYICNFTFNNNNDFKEITVFAAFPRESVRVLL